MGSLIESKQKRKCYTLILISQCLMRMQFVLKSQKCSWSRGWSSDQNSLYFRSVYNMFTELLQWNNRASIVMAHGRSVFPIYGLLIAHAQAGAQYALCNCG